MSTMRIRPGTDIEVELCGDVPEEAITHACDKVMPLVRYRQQPVLGAWVKLTRRRDSSAARAAIAEATVDLNGRLVRAQAAAASVPEAIDLLGNRLAGRLALAGRDEAVYDRETMDHGFTSSSV